MVVARLAVPQQPAAAWLAAVPPPAGLQSVERRSAVPRQQAVEHTQQVQPEPPTEQAVELLGQPLAEQLVERLPVAVQLVVEPPEVAGRQQPAGLLAAQAVRPLGRLAGRQLVLVRPVEPGRLPVEEPLLSVEPVAVVPLRAVRLALEARLVAGKLLAARLLERVQVVRVGERLR